MIQFITLSKNGWFNHVRKNDYHLLDWQCGSQPCDPIKPLGIHPKIRDTARRRLEVATLAAREVWRRSPKGSIEKWENPGGVHEWWKATWLDWGLGGDFLLVGEIMENHRDGSYLSGNMWKTNEFFPRQTIWKWWVVHIYLNVYRMLGLFRLSHIIQAWRIGWWPMKPSRPRAGQIR